MVHEDGEYTIRLRRWPETADLSIDAPLAPGKPVPGTKAFRLTPGKSISPVKASLRIGEATAEAIVKPGQKEVVLKMTLKKGKTRMKALFTTADGEEYGAYYAYVSK